MKKTILVFSLLIFSALAFCQVAPVDSALKKSIDSLKAKPVKDSIVVLPDTVIFKIPRDLVPTFAQMLGRQDHSFDMHIDIIARWNKQYNDQLLKKPAP